MHRFMVLSSIHFMRQDSATSVTRWAHSMSTFYVDAVDGETARMIVDHILKSGRGNDKDFVGTSGSVIAHDEHGHPIDSTYYYWSDL